MGHSEGRGNFRVGAILFCAEFGNGAKQDEILSSTDVHTTEHDVHSRDYQVSLRIGNFAYEM